jgi:hypothetical protein
MLQRKNQPKKAKEETKTVRSYAAPQLVVLGQARDLLQGGFPPGVYDYNRGYVRR